MNAGVPVFVAVVALWLVSRARQPGGRVRAVNQGEARWPESRKLASLDAEFRPKVERILRALRAEFGADNIVLFFAYRSPETQAYLTSKNTGLAAGSKHVRSSNGQPAALAVDIVHRTGWETPEAQRVFSRLGELAAVEGLRWGGLWAGKKYDPAHVEEVRWT